MANGLFVRTCQECGHKQEMKDPGLQRGDGWTETKCRKCKSAALDYGSNGYERDEAGSLVRIKQD